MQARTAIVIGAGAAGASAAFRLQQAGVAVSLIECAERVGGRTLTGHIDGFIVDLGAGLLPGTYQAVYRLMADAGLADALEPMRSPTAVARDGRLHYLDLAHMGRSILGTRLLGMRSKLSLARAGITAARMWPSLGFDSLAPAAPHDTCSIADYAGRALTPELLEYLVNPTEKIMYTLSAAEASLVDFFWCAKNLMSPQAYCVRGGMDRIVARVAERLPLRLGTRALAVTEHADRVEVQSAGPDGAVRTEQADMCVIATPAREVPKLDRGLSDGARRFLEGLRYSTLTDLHLRLRRRPAEKAVLIMVPDTVDRELCGILLEHNKGSDRAPPGKGALSAYFLDRWARQAYHWPDEEIFRQGLAKVEKVMPGVGALVEGYHVQRWDYAATASYPGYYKALAGFVAGLDTNRRVQLAGDYFSMASVNTAVTSGELAAQRLIHRYLGRAAEAARAAEPVICA